MRFSRTVISAVLLMLLTACQPLLLGPTREHALLETELLLEFSPASATALAALDDRQQIAALEAIWAASALSGFGGGAGPRPLP